MPTVEPPNGISEISTVDVNQDDYKLAVWPEKVSEPQEHTTLPTRLCPTSTRNEDSIEIDCQYRHEEAHAGYVHGRRASLARATLVHLI